MKKTKRQLLLEQLQDWRREIDQIEGPVGAYGLTQREVSRLREIVFNNFGVELTNEEAWSRAIELMAFAKMMLEAFAERDDRPPWLAAGLTASTRGVCCRMYGTQHPFT